MSPEEALGRLALELEGTSAYTDLVVPLMRPIAHVAQLERRAQAVRDAWQVAQADDHLLPQGFGWPGDLYDALEAL